MGTVDPLTPDERQKIYLAFLQGMGGEARVSEFSPVEAWAREARLQAKLLELVLEGTVLLVLREGRVGFRLAEERADGTPH